MVCEERTMNNFVFHNPVKIVFGKGAIAELGDLIPVEKKVLMTYGGGSIKQNGVYDQVLEAMKRHILLEFTGIEPNPRYETCMRAVEICREENIDFLLAVGGGSVLDGTKFIAAASSHGDGDPWDILAKGVEVRAAIPVGTVLTLPATGSEMNTFAVISRDSTREKLNFSSPHVYPRFSVLDPETTYSLPRRQLLNGIVDTFVHVLEQYATYNVDTPLQDRQAEAIMATLVEVAPRVLTEDRDYNSRASLMWCAAQALNGLISCGVVQDWTTHMIGHELTAFFGIDHGQSLAVVLPGVLLHQLANKRDKLAQFARRVWDIQEGSTEEKARAAVERTELFFKTMGMATRLSDYGIDADGIGKCVGRFEKRGTVLGEHENITAKEIGEILTLRL
jgi:NADP-dependent alcohol dehydrogenase